jgi:hypothetical protein
MKIKHILASVTSVHHRNYDIPYHLYFGYLTPIMKHHLRWKYADVKNIEAHKDEEGKIYYTLKESTSTEYRQSWLSEYLSTLEQDANVYFIDEKYPDSLCEIVNMYR